MSLLWDMQQAVADARFDRIIDVLAGGGWPPVIEGLATATAYIRVGAEVRCVEKHPALSDRVPISLPEGASALEMLSNLAPAWNDPAPGQTYPLAERVSLPVRRAQTWFMHRLDPHDLRHEEQLVRELSGYGHRAMQAVVGGVRFNNALPIGPAKVLPWSVSVW